MKKIIMLIAALTAIPTISLADAHWECRSGSNGKCLVTSVEVHTSDSGSSNDNYVQANLADPNNVTGCKYLRIAEGHSNASQMTISMAESILMTALTTGLPFMFKTNESSNYCYVDKLVITRP